MTGQTIFPSDDVFGYSYVSPSFYATENKLDDGDDFDLWSTGSFFISDLTIPSEFLENWELEIGWLKEDGYSDELSSYTFYTTEGMPKYLDIRHSPLDITLSTLTIDTNINQESSVATISTDDPDEGDTLCFCLVMGTLITALLYRW